MVYSGNKTLKALLKFIERETLAKGIVWNFCLSHHHLPGQVLIIWITTTARSLGSQHWLLPNPLSISHSERYFQCKSDRLAILFKIL